MMHASSYADVIVVLGVSGCLFFPILRKICRARVLLNVDGIEWRRDKWSGLAKKFLRLSEGVGVRRADVVIADNLEIRRYIRKKYNLDAACIAYGGDHATKSDVHSLDAELYPFLKYRYAVKVCRIEPENNVHIVLEAFSRLKSLSLVLIGNWESSEYGRSLRAAFEGFDNLFLLDPIYSSGPLNTIRSSASIYVHGHSAGGTNPSLVEAMSLGLAVCAFDVPYNRETTDNRAIYFDTAESLLAILSTLTDKEIVTNAFEMRGIANERYTWSWISDQYSAIIKPE
jgi:glycosyltransferase involved in cell wall biosynthesis